MDFGLVKMKEGKSILSRTEKLSFWKNHINSFYLTSFVVVVTSSCQSLFLPKKSKLVFFVVVWATNSGLDIDDQGGPIWAAKVAQMRKDEHEKTYL